MIAIKPDMTQPPDLDPPAAPAPPAVDPAPPELVMDIHKPKPFHSLREFGSEIIVIVTGILIALTLEQVVEEWHWREQVESANMALGQELTESYGQGLERQAMSDCIDRRLDMIQAVIDTAATTGRLPPVGALGSPPVRTWSHGTWDSTLAGQTGEHLPPDIRNAYSVIYGFVARISDDNQREIEAWTQIYTIVGPGRAIGPAEIDLDRLAIGKARLQNQLMGIETVRVQQVIDLAKVRINPTFLKTFQVPAAGYSICQPIGAVPPHYGNAQLSNGIATARQHPILQNSAPSAVSGAPGK